MEEEVYMNHFSCSPSSWMPGREKMVIISSPSSTTTTTTAALSDSNMSEGAAHTPATSADSKDEHGRAGLKMEIGRSASASGLPDQRPGEGHTPVHGEDDNDDGTPIPTYSWVLPTSQSISPLARATSPSTASSASASSSSSASSENNSTASSLALFIKNHITRLRENPRPILANRLSNLGPMRPEGRISRWMLDVEAQTQQRVGKKGARWNGREGEEGRRIGEAGRGYGTLEMSADRGVVAKQRSGVYGSGAQASEDECETGDGCACGCWWQWVLLTMVVLALMAWGLWVFLGDQDPLGMKRES